MERDINIDTVDISQNMFVKGNNINEAAIIIPHRMSGISNCNFSLKNCCSAKTSITFLFWILNY